MGTLDEEIELGMVEEALFGLSVAARLGSLEKAVATVFLREMDGQTGARVSQRGALQRFFSQRSLAF